MCLHCAEVPSKNIVPELTEQAMGTMQRLHAIISRLMKDEPPELYRMLCHADVVIATSGVQNLNRQLGDVIDAKLIKDFIENGQELLTDKETEGEGPGGWYATTMRHLDWLKQTTPDLKERAAAEDSRARFFMALANVDAYRNWTANMQIAAQKTNSQLWANIASSSAQLLKVMTSDGRDIARDKVSPIIGVGG